MPLVQKGVSMVVDRMPKVIGPRTHALIDYAVAGTFFTMGALFWRRNKRASICSFVCGAAATANSLLTNYPGGVWKIMDFETHGGIDAGLAGITAAMPDAMFFSGTPESRFFRVQGIAETAVTALTDFKSERRTDYYRHHRAA